MNSSDCRRTAGGEACSPAISRGWRLAASAVAVLALAACAAPQAYDYSAFKASKPASLLVLPPLNDTNEVTATPGVLATATAPLAEAGYYVLPVAMVEETFKQNGLTTAHDMHDVQIAKLREIFGADAAVYLRVLTYGTQFMLLNSETRVTVEARIVDLRTGQQLWDGRATASSAEGQNNQGGLVGLLVKAVVNQIVGTMTDASYNYAVTANGRLLGPNMPNGVLPGPRARVEKKE